MPGMEKLWSDKAAVEAEYALLVERVHQLEARLAYLTRLEAERRRRVLGECLQAHARAHG